MTRAALVLALALLSCGPEPDGPFRAEVVRFDPGRGRYVPGLVEVRTLSNLARMEGHVVRLLAGARFRYDPEELVNAAGEEQARDMLRIQEGVAPAFDGFVRGGVVHGSDFHSVNLLTTYWNFEHAFLWFQERGLAEGEVGTLDAHYFPEFVEVVNGAEQPMTNNALFFPLFKSFLVLPFEDIGAIPLSMNEGVVAHEYSHAVFNARVFGGESTPWPYLRLEEDPAAWIRQINLLKSLDEGLADYFGASIVGDPDFMARSLPAYARARDPRTLRCVTPALREALRSDLSEYDPYPLGTVLHHVLHALGGEEVGRAAVAALVDLGSDLRAQGPDLDEAQLLARVIGRLGEDRRARACGLAADRFGRSPQEIPGCPAGAPAPTERCP